MKTLILALALLAPLAYATKAHATAETDYNCGPYRLDLRGPDETSLYDADGKLLHRWTKDGTDPTAEKDGVLYLHWKHKQYECEVVHSGGFGAR